MQREILASDLHIGIDPAAERWPTARQGWRTEVPELAGGTITIAGRVTRGVRRRPRPRDLPGIDDTRRFANPGRGSFMGWTAECGGYAIVSSIKGDAARTTWRRPSD